MPRELTTWGCDFRCGYVNTKRPKIEKHEKTCFHNPARRACKTCKHDECTIYMDGDREPYCAVDARPNDVNALADCPAWESCK